LVGNDGLIGVCSAIWASLLALVNKRVEEDLLAISAFGMDNRVFLWDGRNGFVLRGRRGEVAVLSTGRLGNSGAIPTTKFPPSSTAQIKRGSRSDG